MAGPARLYKPSLSPVVAWRWCVVAPLCEVCARARKTHLACTLVQRQVCRNSQIQTPCVFFSIYFIYLLGKHLHHKRGPKTNCACAFSMCALGACNMWRPARCYIIPARPRGADDDLACAALGRRVEQMSRTPILAPPHPHPHCPTGRAQREQITCQYTPVRERERDERTRTHTHTSAQI